MKKLLLLVLLVGAGYYFYHTRTSGPPQVIEDPVYGEMRVAIDVQGREIEMALFVRATDKADCQGRGSETWKKIFDACPTCTVERVQCQAELPPRYARLFDDVPIPSAYLSATAGEAGERDGRVVVYGLNPEEGMQVCGELEKAIAKKYRGQLTCIEPVRM